jgi:hypothetical protein
MNFVKCYELDVTFCLMKSLKKIDLATWRNPKSLEGSFFPFGLTKMFVEAIL